LKDDILAQDADLINHEQTLYAALNVYIQRLAWLNSGSRQYFGVLTEGKVAVVVDVTHRRINRLKKALCTLIEDQLVAKSKFILIKYAHKAKASRSFHSNYTDLDAALEWVDSLKKIKLEPKREEKDEKDTSAEKAPGSNRKVGTALMSTNMSPKKKSQREKEAEYESEQEEEKEDDGSKEIGGDIILAINEAIKTKVKNIYLVVGREPRYPFSEVFSELEDTLAGSDIIINVVSFCVGDKKVRYFIARGHNNPLFS
jgi:hypothetical protein